MEKKSIKFKSRSRFKVFRPKKSVNYGPKNMGLCDVRSSYSTLFQPIQHFHNLSEKLWCKWTYWRWNEVNQLRQFFVLMIHWKNVRYPFGHEDSLLFKTTWNTLREDQALLPLVRNSWKVVKTKLSFVHLKLKFVEIQNYYLT